MNKFKIFKKNNETSLEKSIIWSRGFFNILKDYEDYYTEEIATENIIKKIVENAETYYEILDKNNNSTFIQLKPITGRKHQLRKQLYDLGHSIIGDKKYNSFKLQKNNKNLMLHSYEIKFKMNELHRRCLSLC